MKFMILVKSNPDLEAHLQAMSDSQMKDSMAAMEVFNEELRKAGVLKDCDGLRLSLEGKRVRFDGTARTVVDGPFTGDLVAGYWLWELPSIEDAVAWVKRCPKPIPLPVPITYDHPAFFKKGLRSGLITTVAQKKIRIPAHQLGQFARLIANQLLGVHE
jgi:hypothetical protein